MDKFVEKYIMSLMLLLSFIVFSPLFTDWYQNNVLTFLIMLVILTPGNFLIESLANNKYSEVQLKTKRIAPFLLPLNWIVAIGFVFILF